MTKKRSSKPPAVSLKGCDLYVDGERYKPASYYYAKALRYYLAELHKETDGGIGSFVKRGRDELTSTYRSMEGAVTMDIVLGGTSYSCYLSANLDLKGATTRVTREFMREMFHVLSRF